MSCFSIRSVEEWLTPHQRIDIFPFYFSYLTVTKLKQFGRCQIGRHSESMAEAILGPLWKTQQSVPMANYSAPTILHRRRTPANRRAR